MSSAPAPEVQSSTASGRIPRNEFRTGTATSTVVPAGQRTELGWVER